MIDDTFQPANILSRCPEVQNKQKVIHLQNKISNNVSVANEFLVVEETL